MGGILNDASFVVCTPDPGAVKGALRAWIESQRGERDGLRIEPSWEDARQLNDGSTVSAFAVKETVIGPGPDVTGRLVKQFLVSSRGLHGFAREVPGAPQEVLLVLDATVGQNGLAQAREFTNVAGVNGIVLTKLDGTAKGGIAVAIANDLKLPIRWVGVGEGIDDLAQFSAAEYVDGLFEEKW